jgi:hypothetical protein
MRHGGGSRRHRSGPALPHARRTGSCERARTPRGAQGVGARTCQRRRWLFSTITHDATSCQSRHHHAFPRIRPFHPRRGHCIEPCRRTTGTGSTDAPGLTRRPPPRESVRSPRAPTAREGAPRTQDRGLGLERARTATRGVRGSRARRGVRSGRPGGGVLLPRAATPRGARERPRPPRTPRRSPSAFSVRGVGVRREATPGAKSARGKNEETPSSVASLVGPHLVRKV